MNIRRILITTVLGAAAVGAANADTIGYLSNAVGPSGTEVIYSLTLQKFDPVAVAASIGAANGVTLTGVTLFFRGSETSTNLSFKNSSAQSQTFDGSVAGNLTKTFSNSAVAADKFTGENLYLFDNGQDLLGALGSCPAVSPGACGPITIGAGVTNQYAPVTINNTDAAYGLATGTGALGLFGVDLAGSSLAGYTGSTTFTLAGSTKNSFSVSGGGGAVTFAQLTNATFQAEVDYSYTINPAPGTPEPATLALVGGGLLALGLLRKRTKN